MKMIVGLGKPGKEYENTRHNVGFMILDSFIKDFKLEKKFQAMIKVTDIDGEKCLFVKPLTFMNESGLSVGKIAKYYNISCSDIFVIQDDMDLPFGKIKLKINSSAGGHNGIKSIIASLGNQDFPRLKVGIGSVKKDEVIDYVLGKFSKSELEVLNELFNTFDKIINSFINEGIDKTMNVYNTK